MKKKPVKRKVQRKPAPRKRVSHRVYPDIKCLKTDCPIVFPPSSKKQKYCCTQHRIDQNNDNRDIKAEPQIIIMKIHARNREILKKIFEACERVKNPIFNRSLLEYEGFNDKYSTTETINKETGETIRWSPDYGLECYNRKLETFIIHKR